MTTAADPATPAPRDSDDAGARLSISAAQVASWGFAFLLLRVFAVSSYDWDTAFLVSTTLGLDDGLALLLGSLMASYLLTAILLVYVLPLMIAAAVWGRSEYRRTVILLATLGVVALVALTVSHRLWWLPVATLAVLALLLWIGRLPPANRLRRTIATGLARIGLLTGLGTLLVAALVSTPWVPHEEITTSAGVITGHVLSVDPGYLNVLTDDHEFVIVPTTDVVSRK